MSNLYVLDKNENEKVLIGRMEGEPKPKPISAKLYELLDIGDKSKIIRKSFSDKICVSEERDISERFDYIIDLNQNEISYGFSLRHSNPVKWGTLKDARETLKKEEAKRNMKYQHIKVEILVGLPGCGKTSYVKQYKDSNNQRWSIGKKTVIYNLDDKRKSLKEIENELFYRFDAKDTEKVIIDGLFLTQESYIEICKTFIDYNLCFVYWNPDKRVSLYNDMYRREQPSEMFIKNAIIEKPDLDLLKTIHPLVKVEIRKTYKKSDYQLFKDKYDLWDTFESSTWNLGSVSFDYSGNICGYSSAESPVDFVKFNELIYKIVPNIGLMPYKNIWNKCVRTETRDANDYYSRGQVSLFICNTLDLFNALIENNLIDMSKEVADIENHVKEILDGEKTNVSEEIKIHKCSRMKNLDIENIKIEKQNNVWLQKIFSNNDSDEPVVSIKITYCPYCGNIL